MTFRGRLPACCSISRSCCSWANWAGASVPLLIGGWQHPIEINLAAYTLWIMLAAMLAYSMWAQHQPTWRMMLGFLLGNVSMVTLGLVRGGYTFNLGTSELIVLFGMVLTVVVWLTARQITSSSNPRILLLGGVTIDVITYYPLFKQYLMQHEPPTAWLKLGWCMQLTGITINLFVVERIVQKIRYREKPMPTILEETAFSLECCIFVSMLLWLMSS